MALQTSYEFVLNKDEMSEIIEKQLSDSDKFQPYSVIVKSEHAYSVEFGSPPIVDGKFEPRRNRTKGNSPFFESLKKWFMARNNGVWDKESVYRIYKHIMENGTPPQPFMRPAYHDLIHKIENGEDIDDNSFEAFAKWLKERMIFYLEENKTIYDGGEIKESIFIEPLSEKGEGVERPDMNDKLWESDYANYRGDPQPAMERKQNINNLRWK